MRRLMRPNKFPTTMKDTPLITMNLEDWAEKFKPMDNHLDKNAPIDGLMFETYGAELAHVLMYANGYFGKAGKRQVWTVVDGDDGELVMCEGYHLCNRVGYLITSKPFKSGAQYNVSV